MADPILPRWGRPGAGKDAGPPDDAIGLSPGAPHSEVCPAQDRFPFCLVWTPLPVIGWLAPFVGHLGICRSDGTTLDFAGSYFVNLGGMAFGPPVKYLRLLPSQGCFPHGPGSHACAQPQAHEDHGCSQSWDAALGETVRRFQHQPYNIFTCNCHSFVSCCLNRMAFGGRMGWNVVRLAWLILAQGVWVSRGGLAQSFLPSLLVALAGWFTVGWTFLLCWLAFDCLLAIWFVLGTFVCTGLVRNM